MAHFYAEIVRSTRQSTPSAQGTINTGIAAYCASYEGKILTRLWQDREGIDRFIVTMETHLGKGDHQLLAEGIVGNADSTISQIKQGLEAVIADRDTTISELEAEIDGATHST